MQKKSINIKYDKQTKEIRLNLNNNEKVVAFKMQFVSAMAPSINVIESDGIK